MESTILYTTMIGTILILGVILGGIVFRYADVFITANRGGEIAAPRYVEFNVRRIMQFFVIALLTRALLLLAGYLWFMTAHNGAGLGNGFFTDFARIFSKWDAPHYVDIAVEGYVTNGDHANFIVFYPLLPLLLKFFSFICGDVFFAGTIISVLCMTFAGYFLFILVKNHYSEHAAWTAALLLMLNPLSIFFSIAYTEALFIMLVCGCALYASRQRYLVAGCFAFFAALTKNQGLLLFLLIAAQAFVSPAVLIELTSKRIGRGILVFLKKAWPALLCLAGFFVYLLVNFIVWGDWFKFLEIQQGHWYNSLDFMWNTVATIVKNMLNPSSFSSGVFIFGLEFVALLAVFGLIAYAVFKKTVQPTYLLFAVAFVILSYSATWTISGARYLSALFVSYMILASFPDKKGLLRTGLVAASSALAVFFTLAYVNGSIL